MIQPNEAIQLLRDTHKGHIPPDKRAKLANDIRAFVEETHDSLDASIRESITTYAVKVAQIQCVFPAQKITDMGFEPNPLNMRTIAAVAEKEFRKFISAQGWKENIVRITSEPLWMKQPIGNHQVIAGLRFTIILEIAKPGEDTDFDSLVIIQ